MAIPDILHKREANPPPNLGDYERAYANFTWDAARAELSGLPDGRGLNIAHEAVDRYIADRADHLALRCIGRSGERREFSFAALRTLTNRFANVLRGLGYGDPARVFVLAARIPELYVSVPGTLKHRSLACTLFSARNARSRPPRKRRPSWSALSERLGTPASIPGKTSMSTFTPEEIRAQIFDTLAAIAPEVDTDAIVSNQPLREQIALDSFDFLNVIVRLHERLGIDIPESDYGKLATLDSAIEYLVARCETPKH